MFGALLTAALVVQATVKCKGTAPATDAWCDTNCNLATPICPPALCNCGSGPAPPSKDCATCAGKGNCYHPSWAAHCSDAVDEASCKSSSEGAEWCPAAPPGPPAKKGTPFVGGYILLSEKDGLKRLQALADNADTIPITRLWLAFVSPNMVYVPGSKTLAQVGFGLPTLDADAGYAVVEAAVKKLEAAGVETYMSMGGWNYNCFPYFYARYSVGGYGEHSPNYWKIKQYGGNVSNCTKENQYCYVCEPISEKTSLDMSFAIFPEPVNSSTWKAAQKYVEANATKFRPSWHPEMMAGKDFVDTKTNMSVTVPGTAPWAAANRDPYEDLVLLAKDLGMTGVDIDYEEMWHADYFKVPATPSATETPGGNSTGPWVQPITAYKYTAIAYDVMQAVKTHAPKIKVSTAASAMGAWTTAWWGGNLKGLWTDVEAQYSEVIKFMSEGDNAGGINVMTYDLSSNMDYHECPKSGMCTLDEQVNFYMGSYRTNGITANVGYEIGQPAYPFYKEDKEHELPLTKDELSKIMTNTQKSFGGGFIWEMYKLAGDGEATPTETLQAICNVVMPGNKRCKGVVPDVKDKETILVV